ncbi:S-adenosyl-L-methionine-dependent methyltransferase [Fusarium flagelliforme]|uniref:S-adenosyl-l-methionine-dependent methyltransferase n=1 Tax=Fusarium flagelliforme TaxID=2675880 RepID=A0A395MN17_9HYPO|nr:S-adenosyl-L-methionine-dependent methyltransferase [Fusarium flagelliforme]KAH7173970.1 S-adenosyl-L-methionine-dependent methyltransferase [Fusarium flagelliforme]RFN48975.1 s-adenosyl-l-methionine-dependent methyltransferase [Fusarium flagelliforme]
MNAPESDNPYVPKQALKPTPALYGELVGDGMERLAAASISYIDLPSSEVIFHDVGCGLGAATAAIAATSNDSNTKIIGSDIDDNVLDLYRQGISKNHWPAEVVKADATALDFPGETFTHAIGNALLFVLPNDGIDAIKEIRRTLKPDGIAIFNSWAYTPTLPAIITACEKTRPAGTPLPRQGLEKWEDANFLRQVTTQGGFSSKNVKMEKRDVFVTIGELKHFATMLWSFIGGTSSVGWLESDEENWDDAVETVAEVLQKSEGFKKLEDGKNVVMFKANIAIATK